MKRLDKIIKNRAYYKIIESSYVCHVAQEELDKIFSEGSFLVISFRNGKLNVKAKNNFLKTEAKLKQKNVVSRITAKLVHLKIDNIKFNILL